MKIKELLSELNSLDDIIQEGDIFELEIGDDFILETVVIGVRHDGPILAIDETALAYLHSQLVSESFNDGGVWGAGAYATLQSNPNPPGGTNSTAEDKYHGREVKLGKPMKGDVKKSKVYVKDPKTGNIKKVNFGDKNMRIKKSSPSHRKSFRARHHCENPGPRTKARYWSCRAW
jgi:hypothetical protein